ncbi:MAG: hypothetical protein WC799_15070 [Desulfobacteraceae bacterium]|jgi:hypothetical protein
MKTSRIMMVTFLIWGFTFTLSAWAKSSLHASAEWPFSPPTLFLKGGVNAVTAGSDLLFWAIGDTVEVIDKSSFSHRSTFHVATSTAIQDILFDEASKTLYVAAGYDEKEQSGGLQIFNVSDPLNPTLIMIYDESDNPGSYRESDTEVVAVPDIDARGLGLYGNTLYLVDDNFGLRVIDVSDMTQPIEIPLTTPTENRTSGYKQPNINEDFGATGGYVNLSLYPYNDKIYAFVLDFYSGVKVFDVTDPASIADPILKDTRTNIWFGAISLVSDIFVTETGGRLTAFVTSGNATGSAYVIARLDVSFDENLPIENFGRCVTTGEARSVSAAGDYAYVADGASGLTVVDISGIPASDAESVLTYQIVGSYTTDAAFSYNVFLDGAVLYLATGESGLNKLDVAQPKTPIHLSNLESPISGDDVCVSGNFTYMLDRKKGLRIFDSTIPDYILLRSFLEYPGTSADLAVSGNYAYIANTTGYISIVNVADPLAPVITGATIPASNPHKLFISGNVLYIADGADGLRLVDITDPLNPDVLSLKNTVGTAVSVYAHGDKAYVASGTDGISILDVSNPANPEILVSATTTNARDISLLVNDNSLYALVADGSAGLKIFDVSDTDNPLPEAVVVSNMNTDLTVLPTPFTAISVATLGNLVFVGMGANGILTLDCDVPLSPVVIEHESSDSYTSDIVTQTINKTPYITVADRSIGFRILYLSTSTDTDDDDEDFVPTIDAGCFIGTAVGSSSVKEKNGGWIEAILKLFSPIILNDSHNETKAWSYLNGRI